MPDDVPRPQIDADLVERLVAAQFPQWSALPVVEVEPQGWDNRTYRLGAELSVRLPSAARYVAAVEKEQRVLPYLAAHLDVPVPEPVGLGVPDLGYPFPWSVRRWIDGTVAHRAPGLDRARFASDVGTVLRQLRAVPAADGPVAGAHSFHRGAHPSHYDSEVTAALDRLGTAVDRSACERVWAAAVATTWSGPPVWFHGDVAPGNLLVAPDRTEHADPEHAAAAPAPDADAAPAPDPAPAADADRALRLTALIDFGTCGVGDPACDLVLAWTFLDGAARTAFRDAVGLGDDTWARARGWALWKALIMLAGSAGPGDRSEHEAVLAAVLTDPVASA